MGKRLLSVLILAALLLTSAPVARTQDPVTPLEPPCACGPEGPCKADDGHWYMQAGAQPAGETHAMSPQETGGPDDFGYTWDDSVAMNWIDVTNGTDAGMSGHSRNQATGPIPLPFSFEFYENTYTQVHIAASGYLAFTEKDSWPSQGSVPSPAKPNGIIAPYWAPFDLASSGKTGRVFYSTRGEEPNRYFVVQWNEVSYGSEGPHTFQVILYENGDIAFQYGTMTYESGYWCASAGIEDSFGLDGLAYVDYCGRIRDDHKAVRFYRPDPSARVSIHPLHHGHFVRAGEIATFQIPIRNTGELGTDIYDITAASAWPIFIYDAFGAPLTDTDGDGTIDTGNIAQGSTKTVMARVRAPSVVNPGDANEATITVQSSLDTEKQKSVSLQTGTPAPFAQVYRDDADGAMTLYLAQPDRQSLKKATDDYHYGYDMAVAEMPNGFAYVWSKGRSVNNLYVSEIEYILLDSNGETTRGVTKLTNLSGATMRTNNYEPAVAVAPNGRIGVLWHRYLYNSSNGTSNHNIFFAILDSAGSPVYGPVNLTNNNAWGDYSDYGVPRFYSPRMAPTGDNRFVLAWCRYSQESAGSLSDVYYAVRDANGGAVKDITKFTNGAAGGDYYNYAALSSLSGNQALLVYDVNGSISYAVLDNAGNVVKGEAATGGYGYRPDAVQLANGSVLLAWARWEADVYEINFAVLDGTNYNVVAAPTALTNPAAVTGNDYVSVAADGAGRGILTWMDRDWNYRRNLYYAVVDGSGSVLTGPMIFRTSQATAPRIDTSYEGYGNTSYSLVSPTTDEVDAWVTSSLAGGPPEGTATIPATLGNHGSTRATSVVLTATLDNNLSYNGASPAPVSTGAYTAVWNLLDIDFLGSGRVVLHTEVPSATIGTRYPVTWTLTSAGPDVDKANNGFMTEVMVALQVFLPLVFRGY